MARRGENIYKRKDGRYEGRYVIGRTLEGRTRFGYVYAHSYAQVRQTLLVKKARQFAGGPVASVYGTGRYGEWAEYWLKHCVGPGVRPSTYASYQNILRHLTRGLGQQSMRTLSEQTLKVFLDGLTAQGLARGTRAGILRMLKSSLRAARDARLMADDPCARLRLEKRIPNEQRVLSREEQRSLCAESLRRDELGMLMGLCLGLRVGEVCGLMWNDIHWKENALTVRRTVQRNACTDGVTRTQVLAGTPKSLASARTVPVPDFLMDLLKRRTRQAGCADGYILSRAGAVPEPRTLQRRLESMTRGLGLQGVHFHTLRHTFATRLLEVGVDIKTVSVLLGHSSTRVTLDVYAHATLEQRRRAMERIAQFVA